MGLEIPDPDLKWNEARGSYDFGKINWDELKQIQFKSFAWDFLFNNGKSLLVVLRTTNEGSMEVKKSLMEVASKKSIQIVAG